MAKAGRRPDYFFQWFIDKRGGEMAAEGRRSDQGGEIDNMSFEIQQAKKNCIEMYTLCFELRLRNARGIIDL